MPQGLRNIFHRIPRKHEFVNFRWSLSLKKTLTMTAQTSKTCKYVSRNFVRRVPRSLAFHRHDYRHNPATCTPALQSHRRIHTLLHPRQRSLVTLSENAIRRHAHLTMFSLQLHTSCSCGRPLSAAADSEQILNTYLAIFPLFLCSPSFVVLSL